MATERSFAIRFEASDKAFGKRAAGAPFLVYARHGDKELRTRDYAVAPGDRLEDVWSLSDFKDGGYHLCVYGPNGFYREFRGDANDPPVEIQLKYERGTNSAQPLSGNLVIEMNNRDKSRSYTVDISDLAYKTGTQRRTLAPARMKPSNSIASRVSAGTTSACKSTDRPHSQSSTRGASKRRLGVQRSGDGADRDVSRTLHFRASFPRKRIASPTRISAPPTIVHVAG